MSPGRDRPRSDEEESLNFFGDDPRPGRGRGAKPARASNAHRARRSSEEKTQRAAAKADRRSQKHQRREDSQKRRAAEKQADARAGSARRKDRKLADDFFGEEVVEAPAEGADIYRSASRRAKFQRGLIKTTLFVVAPLALGGNVAVLGAVMNQDVEEADPVQTTSQHKPLAITAVEEYLAGEQEDSQPLPGVELIGWDYAVPTYDGQEVLRAADLSAEALEEELPQAISYETHHLSLRSTSGTFYTAEVQVAHSQVDGAWVTTQPSITAQVPEGGGDSASGTTADVAFPSLPETQASEAMESSAQTWAEAYYSGSPSILKQTLGDGRGDTSYMPMPLAEDVEVEIGAAAIASGSELFEDAEGEEHPGRVVARVDVEASWPEVDAESDEQHPMSGFSDAVELDADGTVVDPEGESADAGASDDDSGLTPEEPSFDEEENLVVIPEVEGVSYDPEPGEHEVGPSGLEVTAEPQEDVEFAQDAVTRWEFGTDDSSTGDGDAEDPHVAAVSYDVLIAEAHTATPRIVAWGAPGSGAQLETFGNAEVGLLLEDDSDG